MAHRHASPFRGDLMAYLQQRRQQGRPIRLCLAGDLGRRIDGAWWPYSSALADELGGLVAALDDQLGKVVEVGLNWSPLNNPPSLNWRDWRTKPQHIITVGGRDGTANLLIVPSATNGPLAGMVLRRAAGLPVEPRRGDVAMLDTVEEILTAARRQRITGKPLE
ncbi:MULTISPECIES: DUF5994 family protein [Mycobacteriaceae]|nr:DUF5994 family protein [Mycolicibacterium mucogenicum]